MTGPHVLALRFPAGAQPGDVEEALRHLADEERALRTWFREVDGRWERLEAARLGTEHVRRVVVTCAPGSPLPEAPPEPSPQSAPMLRMVVAASGSRLEGRCRLHPALVHGLEDPDTFGERLAAAVQRAVQRTAPPPPVAPGHPVRLSPGQEGIWMSERLGQTRAYLVGVGYDVEGELSVPAVERAVRQVVSEQEALRLRVAVEDGVPHQRDAGDVETPVHVHELRGGRHEDRRVAMLAQELCSQPFRLEGGTLFRAHVIRLAPRRHVLVFVFHHLICDTWSLHVFARRLGGSYAAEPGPVAAPFTRFAAQQRTWSSSAECRLAADRAASALEHCPAVLDLAGDVDGDPSSEQGTDTYCDVPADLSEDVLQLCRALHATPAGAGLAAFAAVIAPLVGSACFMVGLPVTNRPLPDARHTMGYFVDIVAVAVDLQEDPRFDELVQQLSGYALSTIDGAQPPLGAVFEALAARTPAGELPTLQVLYSYQEQSYPVPDLPGTTTRYRTVDNATAQFPLVAKLTRMPSGLRLSLRVRTSVYSGSLAEDVLDRARGVLAAGCARPHARIGELAAAAQAERRSAPR